MSRKTACVLISVFILLAATSAAPQSAPDKEPAKKSSTPRGSADIQDKKKPPIVDITRVSTEQAAREAAKEAAQEPEPTANAGDSEVTGVVEFRPAAKDSGAAGSTVTTPPEKEKSKLKNVHGSIHGSASPANTGTHQTGGSVGASSKGGKAHIYVEAERARQAPPSPR